ncbi:MAG: aminopeptidase P family protein [Bacillota bacterium]|nr:aminopeptidase P family protein [Bacillota bacterium]
MLIKDRIKDLRKLMKENNIDIYYVPTDDDHMSEYVASYFKSREFMSGFTGSAGVLVVTQREAGLWTDGRYFVQAEKELKNTGIKLYKQRIKGVPTVSKFIESKIGENGVLGFDGKVVNQNMKETFEKLIKSKNGTIVLDKDLVNEIWNDRPLMPKDKTFFLDDKYTGESVSKKIARVKEEMKKKNVDTLIFSVLEDVNWLFNIRGYDILYTPIVYSYALIDGDDVILYIDSDKLDDRSKKELDKNKVIIKNYDDISNDLGNLNNKKVWIDKSKLNSYLFSFINDSNTIVDSYNTTGTLRAIKNKTQMKNLRNSHLKDGIAMTKFIYYVKNNIGKEEMSEISVADVLEGLRREQEGFIMPSFNTISAYKGNAAMMHYSASKESNATLSNEGFLLVDSGGTYYDGTTDITRTIVLGKITDEEKKLYTLVLRGMLSLMRAKFLYGITGANLDILARGPLWNEDIDYQCGTGHGVGFVMSVHEGPISIAWHYAKHAAVIEEGMVVTNEPGVYIPNKLGIRIENEMLALNGAKNEYGQFMYFEPITYCPIDLDGVDTSLMTYEEIDTLNEYHKMVYDKISPYLDSKEKTWLKLQTRSVKK